MHIDLTTLPSLEEIKSEQAKRKAKRCDRFYCFVQEFWEVIIPETPIWNWHIEFICDEIEKVGRAVMLRQPKEYDLIINVPPRLF
jgi:hypothetical protein